MSIGQVNVKLGLDAAEYVQGLTKAQVQARKFGEEVGSTLRSGVTTATVALGAFAAAGGAAFAFIKEQANAVDAFNDLADATGASIESISALDRIARETGGTFATAEGVLLKFNAALAGAKPDNDAGRLLKAINLDVAQLKALDPAEALRQTAVAFASFENNGEKARAMQELFGKSVKEAAPFLNDLAEKTALVGTTTTTTAQQSELFNKQIANLQANSTDAARAIVSDLLPSLNRVLENFTKIQQQGNLGLIFKDAAKDLFGLGQLSSNPGEDINNLIKARNRLRKDLSFAESKGLPTRDITSSIEENARLLEISRTRQASAVNRSSVGADTSDALSRRLGGGGKSLVLPGKTTGGGAGDDPTKKLLDNDLKNYERFIKDEEDLLRSRNRMLDLDNNANLISTSKYFSEKRAAQEQAVSAQAALYDKEIAALKAYQAKVGQSPERETAQGKIDDLTAKKTSLYREAEQAAIESRAAQALSDQLSGVNADVLELTGNLSAASKIRLDQQYKDLLDRLDVNKNQGGIDQVNKLKQLKTAQTEYNAEQEKASQILASLQVQEERIAIAQQLGADTELGALAKLGEARRGTLAQLESVVLAREAIAKASGGDSALVLQAEQARLAFEKLGAVADPLAQKFNALFSDALGNELADLITGAKSAEDAFKGFAKTVINELANIAAKNFASSIFSGGFGGFFSGGGGGFLSSIFGRARGGMVQPGSLYEVNENGPEMLNVGGKSYLMAGSNGSVSPMDGKVSSNGGATTGGGPISISVSVDASGSSVDGDGQQASQLGSLIGNAVRGVLLQEKRPGGILA